MARKPKPRKYPHLTVAEARSINVRRIGNKGAAAARARNIDAQNGPEAQVRKAIERRNVPVTLPTFKCLEEET